MLLKAVSSKTYSGVWYTRSGCCQGSHGPYSLRSDQGHAILSTGCNRVGRVHHIVRYDCTLHWVGPFCVKNVFKRRMYAQCNPIFRSFLPCDVLPLFSLQQILLPFYSSLVLGYDHPVWAFEYFLMMGGDWWLHTTLGCLYWPWVLPVVSRQYTMSMPGWWVPFSI